MRRKRVAPWALVSLACALSLVACGSKNAATSQTASAAAPAPVEEPKAPSADTTGGFDGQRAYQHVADLVAIGPHSAGTDGDPAAHNGIASGGPRHSLRASTALAARCA